MTRLVCTLPFIVGGAIIIAPVIADFITEPFRAMFYPGERFDRPQPAYGIPQAKRARGLHEEAILEYEKIISEHPGQLKAFTEMIDIAVIDLCDEDRARSIFHRGLAELTEDSDRKALIHVFEATVSRLHGKPEWYNSQQQRVLDIPEQENKAPVDEPDGYTSRRFHAGGGGQYRNPAEPQHPDSRKKVAYTKKP